jgi:hypothetical protein
MGRVSTVMTEEQRLYSVAADYLESTKIIIDRLLALDGKPELRLLVRRLQILTWHSLSND